VRRYLHMIAVSASRDARIDTGHTPMRLVPLPLAGSGGRLVHINPDQVICLMDLGDRRTQIVTTGLSGETSISLITELEPDAVARKLAQPD
jgi:hypothetical protein